MSDGHFLFGEGWETRDVFRKSCACGYVARSYGTELADKLFATHIVVMTMHRITDTVTTASGEDVLRCMCGEVFQGAHGAAYRAYTEHLSEEGSRARHPSGKRRERPVRGSERLLGPLASGIVTPGTTHNSASKSCVKKFVTNPSLGGK